MEIFMKREREIVSMLQSKSENRSMKLAVVDVSDGWSGITTDFSLIGKFLNTMKTHLEILIDDITKAINYDRITLFEIGLWIIKRL